MIRSFVPQRLDAIAGNGVLVGLGPAVLVWVGLGDGIGSVAVRVRVDGDWVSIPDGSWETVGDSAVEQAAMNIKKPTHIPKKCILNDLL
jgi:hypothetical protein